MFESFAQQRAAYDAFFASSPDPGQASAGTLAALLAEMFPVSSFGGEARLLFEALEFEATQAPSRVMATLCLEANDQAASTEIVCLCAVPQAQASGGYLIDGVVRAPALDAAPGLTERLQRHFAHALRRLRRSIAERLSLTLGEGRRPADFVDPRRLALPPEVLLGEGILRPLPLAEGLAPVTLALAVGDGLRLSAAAAARFTSVHRCEVPAPAEWRGVERVSRLPALSSFALLHLEDDGCPAIGASLGAGAPVFARLFARTFPMASTWPAPYGPVRCDVTPTPPGADGLVVEVRRPPRGRITVIIEATRPLQVGDVLLDAGGRRHPVLAVDAALPEGIDGLWSGAAGEVALFKLESAARRLRAVGLGLRAKDKTPPTNLEPFGAIRPPLWAVEAAAAAMPAVAREWLGLLAAPGVRGIAEVLAGAAPPHDPLARLTALLRAARLELRLDARGGRLALLDDAAIRARSEALGPGRPHIARAPGVPAVVTHHAADDLDSEAVFGPVGGAERLERFGRIELVTPTPHPWFARTLLEWLEASPDDLMEMSPEDLRAKAAAVDLEARADEPLAATLIASDLDAGALLIEAQPVVSPLLAPMGEGLRDRVREIVNRNTRLIKLIPFDPPPVILHNERRLVREGVVRLLGEVPLAAGALRSQGCLADALIIEVEALTRPALACSGQALVLPDPAVARGACRLPQMMFQRIFGPLGDELEARPAVLILEDRLLCREASAWDAPAIGLHPEDAEGVASAAVVAPVGPAAVAEVRATDMAPRVTLEPSGWLGQLLRAPTVPTLVEATRRGAVDPLDDPLIAALTG